MSDMIDAYRWWLDWCWTFQIKCHYLQIFVRVRAVRHPRLQDSVLFFMDICDTYIPGRWPSHPILLFFLVLIMIVFLIIRTCVFLCYMIFPLCIRIYLLDFRTVPTVAFVLFFILIAMHINIYSYCH
jgi:hypothetical protein